MSEAEIYSFEVEDAKGEKDNLEYYKGKVLLIVNTASKCGFTKQYGELEKLYKKYKDDGLEILAFPCNQFGKQEQGTNEEIQNFCDINFRISFKVFAKIDVKGKNAHPLFSYLSKEAKGLLGSKDIKWNFTKFLVDRKGHVTERFAPNFMPEKMITFVEDLLGAA